MLFTQKVLPTHNTNFTKGSFHNKQQQFEVTCGSLKATFSVSAMQLRVDSAWFFVDVDANEICGVYFVFVDGPTRARLEHVVWSPTETPKRDGMMRMHTPQLRVSKPPDGRNLR